VLPLDVEPDVAAILQRHHEVFPDELPQELPPLRNNPHVIPIQTHVPLETSATGRGQKASHRRPHMVPQLSVQ
jgi:hypothetical protein